MCWASNGDVESEVKEAGMRGFFHRRGQEGRKETYIPGMEIGYSPRYIRRE